MSAVKNDFPELFPSPKQVTVLEGMSELSTDVRLVTNNVAPLQRKAIRTVLCDVGIRVVANKKKYLVEVKVVTPDNFDLSDVPEESREGYYELKIDGSEIQISAPYQSGTVLGSYTLGELLKQYIAGRTLPNLFVRDWPSCMNRGLYLDCTWGMDKMNLSDWHKAIDIMAGLKFNVLGIGFYNCNGFARYEGNCKPGEFVMTYFENDDKLRVEHNMDWYSGEQDFWNRDVYQADLVATDNLVNDVISYAAEKSMSVIPMFNSLGHNTLFPRVYKEISAKGEDGKPTGVGYCLSSGITREFLERIYGEFLQRYFPNGAEYFDIGLDEVLPDISSVNGTMEFHDGWCHCEECSKRHRGELVTDYVIWLIKMLVSKNVKKVVIHHGLLGRDLKLLNTAFVKRLEAEDLKEHVLVLWQETAETEMAKENRVSNGVKLGLESWIVPLLNRHPFDGYNGNRASMDKVIRQGLKDGATGVMAYSVFDPTHLDHQALLSAYCWETPQEETMASVQEWWSSICFGENAAIYRQAVDQLDQAVKNPVYALCTSYQYTCVDAGKEWPRAYPGEALEIMEADKHAVAELEKVAELARDAEAKFAQLITETTPENEKLTVESLRGECYRILGYVGAFLYFLGIREKMSDGMVLKSMVTTTIKARDDYMDCMSHVEQGKPYHLIPSVMHSMSLMFSFFNQLIYDLKKHAARKQAKMLQWGLVEERK